MSSLKTPVIPFHHEYHFTLTSTMLTTLHDTNHCSYYCAGCVHMWSTHMHGMWQHHVEMYTYTCTHEYACIHNVYTCHWHVHAYIYIYIYTCIHVQMHANHTYISMHICMYTLYNNQLCLSQFFESLPSSNSAWSNLFGAGGGGRAAWAGDVTWRGPPFYMHVKNYIYI